MSLLLFIAKVLCYSQAHFIYCSGTEYRHFKYLEIQLGTLIVTTLTSKTYVKKVDSHST